MTICKSSVIYLQALRDVYPEHEWLGWKLDEQIPKGYWKETDHLREFFNWLSTRLGYTAMDDWYNVSQEDIQKNGGVGLLRTYFCDSPTKALQIVYPEHNWLPWMFNRKYRGFWNHQFHHRLFFDSSALFADSRQKFSVC